MSPPLWFAGDSDVELVRSDPVPTVFQEQEIPKSIRLNTFGSDYVDVFTARAVDATGTSAEQWARAALEGASAVGQFVAWRVVLGLRLKSGGGGDYVAGWEIAERRQSWIRLEARSWFMTANIVFVVEEGAVSFVTSVRYDRPTVSRLVWTPASAVHRKLAPEVLSAAVRRIGRGDWEKRVLPVLQ